MTRAEENYLKAIFHLGESSKGTIATNTIAGQMKTKPSSVTDMVKRLSEKGLLTYTPYKGVSLSSKGTVLALKVIRKHRLWETFLVEKLDFMWDEVHEIAEQLEHIHSEKLIERLDAFLGHPQLDPHGDPIPSSKGEIHNKPKISLSEIPISSAGICIGVKDSSASFLNFLDRNKVSLGDKITLLDREEFDGSLQIKVRNKQLRISKEIAANIYISMYE
jgi:DtxR family Mn-dependent transcriptional regulator